MEHSFCDFQIVDTITKSLVSWRLPYLASFFCGRQLSWGNSFVHLRCTSIRLSDGLCWTSVWFTSIFLRFGMTLAFLSSFSILVCTVVQKRWSKKTRGNLEVGDGGVLVFFSLLFCRMLCQMLYNAMTSSFSSLLSKIKDQFLLVLALV